ncbi:MAG: SH3 domain-containing protein [Anaerolineae bacterium]
MVKRVVVVLLVFCGVGIGLLLLPRPSISRAQDAPTPTEYQIVIPTRTATEEFVITMTPSRTATDYVSTIRIEARDADTPANVRASPELGENIINRIRKGTFYEALGRYGLWIQIRFLASPTGVAWVYSEVVSVTGGTFEDLPEITADALPTVDANAVGQQATLAYITGTPGALQTATAQQAVASGIFQQGQTGDGGVPVEVLPTFTAPPPFVEATLPVRGVTQNSGELPPIVPIISLGVIGLAGLLISGLRRLGN